MKNLDSSGEASTLIQKRGEMEVGVSEVLYNEVIDETGTVPTEGLTDSDIDTWTDSSSAGPGD